MTLWPLWARRFGLPPPAGPLSTAAARDKILSIQILRGIAATMVVFYHANLILGHRSYGQNAQMEPAVQWGWLGVELFFVISGFTIFHAHHADFGRADRLPRYLWRRFARIFPFYWILTACFLLATWYKLDYRDIDIRPGNLMTIVTLLPFVQNPRIPLSVAWTLMFEMMFYGLFTLAIVSANFGRYFWTAWAAAILIASLLMGRYRLDPLNIYNIYFLLGALIWWLLPQMNARWIAPMALLLLVSLVPAIALASIDSPNTHDNIGLAALAPPMALGVALCIGVEKMRPRLFDRRVLLLLGDASYAVYLVHSAILSVAGMAQARALEWVPGLVYFLGSAAVAIIGGVAVHLWFERPLISRLRLLSWGGRDPAVTGA